MGYQMKKNVPENKTPTLKEQFTIMVKRAKELGVSDVTLVEIIDEVYEIEYYNN